MSSTTSLYKQKLREYILVIFVIVLTFISYLPTLSNGFQMEWDDQWMVINSQTVGRPSWYLLLAIFTIPSHGQLAPINQLMYFLLYRTFGFNPVAYHSACLLLHIINVCLLYVGLNIILNDCSKIRGTRANFIILTTIILFAIHPIQVESVAWISASKILLSTTFYFSGAIMLMKFFRNSSLWWYLGALLMQLLAYLSKEQAVVFPLLAILISLWYRKNPRNKRFWTIIIPFLFLSMCSVLHEVFYVANYNQVLQGDNYNWWQRMIFCIYSLFTYFFKWLVPVNLNWMYLFPIEMNEVTPWWLITYPIFAVLLIFTLWDWIKKPIVLSALAFFLIHLLLVIRDLCKTLFKICLFPIFYTFIV